MTPKLALSLTQPWASLVAIGYKKIETRSWSTSYRGPLWIHAAKGFDTYAKGFAQTERALGRIPGRLPFGAIIAKVELIDVRLAKDVEQEISALERLYGDYSWGRYAWIFENVEALAEPIPCKGRLGLFVPQLPQEVKP